MEQAHLAVAYQEQGVVAFGLANDEAGHPPEPFAAAFAIARDAGLLSTPHAGELAGPRSVIGALDALGADRIQHGVRAIEDPALVARLAASGGVPRRVPDVEHHAVGVPVAGPTTRCRRCSTPGCAAA